MQDARDVCHVCLGTVRRSADRNCKVVDVRSHNSARPMLVTQGVEPALKGALSEVLGSERAHEVAIPVAASILVPVSAAACPHKIALFRAGRWIDPWQAQHKDTGDAFGLQVAL